MLKNNKRTKQYLDKLPKIYIVGYWAKCGVRDFPFAGKYVNHKGISIPLVYQFDDNNGEFGAYYLRRIDQTTSGVIFFWTQNEIVARKMANLIRQYAKPTDI